ncbi:DNA-binding protein [Litorivita pollutaquae]|uniref:DNA-binding protein n=1 Tax=Litorivita pollutaquae TaxID=2200892 RepID=A0A2V4MQH5_9RHOB|nr:helix-turn-helix domain-containing protein [Litorivita pollutaquae]PYC47769.1 DNA-binding protein [Litorivita pollutaquae]
MPKQARLSGIKSYRCYTLKEAAALVGVSPRTIRNWIRDGLQLLDASYPPLIRGDDLRAHINAQREGRKVKTGLCEFYCLRCRACRGPAGAMADYEITGNKAMLTAICDVCETLMCKPVSLTSLSAIRAKLDLTIKRDELAL